MQALGAHVDVIPQNCATPEACEKHCAVGCAAGGKRDTARAFLAPAAASGNVTVLCHTAAGRVLTGARAAAKTSGPGGRKQQVTGAILYMVRNPRPFLVPVPSNQSQKTGKFPWKRPGFAITNATPHRSFFRRAVQ